MSLVSNLVASVVSFTKICSGVRNKIVGSTHDKIMCIKIFLIYLMSEDFFIPSLFQRMLSDALYCVVRH